MPTLALRKGRRSLGLCAEGFAALSLILSMCVFLNLDQFNKSFSSVGVSRFHRGFSLCGERFFYYIYLCWDLETEIWFREDMS